MTDHPLADRRWLALVLLCLGELMIVLDTTIVNVALPSIKASLGFDETALAWVINAYMLTYGGFLLLGGRLGDLYGHRRLFLLGIGLFVVASLACGVSTTRSVLVIARAVQGIGGAVVTAVALSLIMDLFPQPADRAKAMGAYGFVCAGGGSIGAMLGGVLTSALSWHWVFLVNLPIGLLVIAWSWRLLPAVHTPPATRHLDMVGAVSITAALMLAVYAVVGGREAGWLSAQTLGFGAVAVLLFVAFLVNESRVKAPLVPLGLFRLRNLSTSSVVGVFWCASMFGWFFLSALYLQLVLGYNPMKVGMAFLPANILMAVFSLGLSAKLVMRFGIRKPLVAGLVLAVTGLLWFARAPVDGNFLVDILPPMLLLGLGGGIAFNPVLMAAMSEVGPNDSGLASGVVNTAFMLGGALGLAVLATLAAVATDHAHGLPREAALSAGYRVAFLVATAFAAIAAMVGGLLLRDTAPTQAH
ncbi:DHA2 family efflux MFS transporter permease subunit [Pinirhizobacter sp.]|jgi:EmrB/QacA subfamily drug resistance transporter|uniref:DHA2 family efflux MFS transporter permease subunit n=1 Tax=Pinirhizobacter sp. TaxID=2950432 RepID=UPI002F42F043